VLDERDWESGFDWVVDALKADHEHVASQMEIEKALAHLRAKQFDKAIDRLKAFEKKDPPLRAMAATNLSFIYFLEGEFKAADAHADAAIRHDRYNAKALVNKGNCLFMAREYARAKEVYLEAIGVEVCVCILRMWVAFACVCIDDGLKMC
jgi:intraflagellar transport protein 88